MSEPRLTFDLSWDEPRDGADPTWGRLCAKLGDTIVWGRKSPTGVESIRWTWGELAEHLAQTWSWLVLENGWPAGPVVRDPKTFLASCEAWLGGMPPEEAAENESMLFEFRHRHDLSMGVQGKLLPQLWIVREGLRACVVTPSASALLPCDQVFEAVEGLADAIVQRVRSLADDRWRSLAAAWSERMQRSTSELAAITVGVDESKLAELADGDVATAFELAAGDPRSFEPNELLAAARMSVPSTDASVVRAIMAAMRETPKRETAELDALATESRAVLDGCGTDMKPALVGVQIGRWLRERLGIGRERRVDVEALLGQWGVQVGELALKDENIEAVACWGPAHGPAILVNPNGRHAADSLGRRTTLAHEVAHLVVDRSAALPLAEVFGGNVSRPVEQRASAFAAEFLIPSDVAGAAFQQSSDANAVLSTLSQRYGASYEVVAWQAYNSGYSMVWPTFALLRKQVSYPDRFLWHVASARRP